MMNKNNRATPKVIQPGSLNSKILVKTNNPIAKKPQNAKNPLENTIQPQSRMNNFQTSGGGSTSSLAGRLNRPASGSLNPGAPVQKLK